MRIVYIIILILVPYSLKGQEFGINASQEMGMGIVFRQSKDYCLNKTRFQGIGFQAGYAWKRKTLKNLHDIAIDFKYSKLKNRYDFLPATFYASPKVSYAYAKKIPLDNLNMKSYLGGQINLEPNIWYYAMWDDSHLYWFSNNNLSLYSNAVLPVNNNVLEFSISFPIVNLVSRPHLRRDYKMDKKDVDYIIRKLYSGLKIQSINRFQGLQFKIGYRYNVSPRFAHKISYNFSFAKNNSVNSDKLSTIDHGLQLFLILDNYEK